MGWGRISPTLLRYKPQLRLYENPRVADWAVQMAQRKMERPNTGPLHASEIYQCLRKTVLYRQNPKKFSKEAVLRFAMGFGVQEYFLGPENGGKSAFGIILSADRVVDDAILEFKTTRRSSSGRHGQTFTPEKAWIDRTLAYCAAYGLSKAHILVMFLYENSLRAWTIEFTDSELEQAKLRIEKTRDLVNRHLDAGTLPGVETRSWDGECRYCPYLEYCAPELARVGTIIREVDNAD